MTWGKAAIEVLFGGPARCDLCGHPAIAFHAGRARCEEHLTQEMRAHREVEEPQGRPYYPARPQLIQPRE
jgi:hypothetical protein